MSLFFNNKSQSAENFHFIIFKHLLTTEALVASFLQFWVTFDDLDYLKSDEIL